MLIGVGIVIHCHVHGLEPVNLPLSLALRSVEVANSASWSSSSRG